jgi:hypothetical protein
MSATLNIGLVAYHAIGNLAFVKVPSERGRYLLTDMCVIAVPCPVCGAVIGEPCRRGYWQNGKRGVSYFRPDDGRPITHGVGTHARRRNDAQAKYGHHYASRLVRHYRLHLAAGDIEAALQCEPESEPTPDGVDIDVPVTRKEG